MDWNAMKTGVRKSAAPIVGTIQWMSSRDVQPKMKSEIGVRSAVKMPASSLTSGGSCQPARS